MEIKEKVKYICPLCGGEHSTREKAVQCYETHCQNLKVEYFWGQSDDFPRTVRLKNDKGRSRDYMWI